MSSRHALTWRQWTGEPDEGLVPFLQQAPGLIYWLVHELFGHGAVLKISYELSQEHPITVPPGWWLYFDGHHISAFERGPVERTGPQKLRGPAAYNVLDAAEGRNPWSYREATDE